MASEHNIAFTNIRCRNVASEVRNRLGIKDKYVVADIVISMEWAKSPKIDDILRYGMAKNNEDAIPIEQHLDYVFIHSCCAMCQSFEGSAQTRLDNTTIGE